MITDETAGFGYGLEPTAYPTESAMLDYLAAQGFSAGIEDGDGVQVYAPDSDRLYDALTGTGWAMVAMMLSGNTIPSMYAVERAFVLPPVPQDTPCPNCGTSRGSGCAVCRPDSVMGG